MTKVVYFGNERLISGLERTDAPLLNGLLRRDYEVVAVVSHHSDSNSRNQRSLEVAEVAKKHGIPVYLPSRPSEIIDELHSFGADIAVLAAYGRIISQQIIDIFPKGIVNIHPSLLPKYRGPTPIESAILNGDDETGVSIMQLTAGMDEGPVYAQQSFALRGDETKLEVYEKIVTISENLFFKTFPRIIDRSLQPTPQDNSLATYSKLIQKTDGVIDWSLPAGQIDRQIRTYLGWPQSKAKLGNVDVIITSAHVVTEGEITPGEVKIVNNHELLIGAGNGSLSIDSLKPLGKKEMPVSAFLAGYQNQLSA